MSGGKGTILVVDDEPDSLALLTTILTEDGHQVRPADSGKLALASVATAPPELILLDLRMPGIDGLEVCRQLKARKETRDIPVLFLSAAADREERVEGLASGAVDFLSKPFFRPELLARVRTHLELSRLRSKLEVQIAKRTEELILTVKRLHAEIAERERGVQALRESEERFRTVADTAPMMIVGSDAHQKATFFNKAWLNFTGRTLEQELGQGWISSLHPDDAEGALEALAASYESRGECRLEYRLRRADGEYRSIICKGVPRFEPDGALAGYIGSAVDITEIKQSQEAALARQKLESLGVLASGIAHDFNNLLGGIIAEAELLAEEPHENPGTRESARKIEAVALRASEIVRQLMAYAGQEAAAFEPVDLAALVREMLELVRVSISKSAELRVEIPEKLPLIQASAAQIRQVVLNLITNASEALGEKRGVISVTAERIGLRPSPELPEADYLRLEVGDTGSGMPEGVLAKIFDPYFSTKAAGRGLGLAAVQGIIRSHRGSITVVSTAGQGSRFSILLPSITGAALDSRGVEIRATVHRGGGLAGTVLVIEDEDALRLALAKVLRRSGLTVFDAADGRTGLDLFRAHAQDIGVVLMDLTLPGVSGPEIFSELQQIRPEMKVIITSAYSQDWALDTLGGRQPWLYIRKPYHLRELVAVLRNAGLEKGLGQASGQG